MAGPIYLTLEEWGGTPNGWPQMTLPAVALVPHHSVTNEDIGVNPTDDAIADFRELDAIGRSKGHGGISYSFAIHPSGVIGEGQGTRRGAHTAGDGCNGSPWGWNPCSFGVVFVGNFDEDTLTPAAIESFRWLRDLLILDGKLVPDPRIDGHGAMPGNATGCPGADVRHHMDALRAPASAPAPPPDEETTEMLLIKNLDTGRHHLLNTTTGWGTEVHDAVAWDLGHKLPVCGLPGSVIWEWAEAIARQFRAG